jgi:hypothetical protein
VHTFTVCLCNLQNSIVLKETLGPLESQLIIALGSERRICRYSDTKRLHESKIVVLSQVRMKFDLNHLWLVTSVFEQVKEQ